MTSVSQITQIVSRATGIPLSRCKQVARRLLEDGHLPLSSGAHIPSVGTVNVILLLLGVLSGVEIRSVSRTVNALFDLRTADTEKTAGQQLCEILTSMRLLDDGAATAMDGEVIIDARTPIVVFRLNVSSRPVESVYAPDGVDTAAIRAETARRCTVMPTRALAKIALALGRNAKET